MLEAQLLIRQLASLRIVIRKERGRLGFVQNLEFFDHDFDFAGGQLRVLSARADAHLALRGNDILVTQLVRRFQDGLARILSIKHKLRQAESIAQVDKDQSGAVAPVGVNPAVQRDGLTDIRIAELAASVRATEHEIPFQKWTATIGKSDARNRDAALISGRLIADCLSSIYRRWSPPLAPRETGAREGPT